MSAVMAVSSVTSRRLGPPTRLRRDEMSAQASNGGRPVPPTR
jgi:hypothetical protein